MTNKQGHVPSKGYILADFRDPDIQTTQIYRGGADTKTLRNVLGQFATGVTIVTTLAKDGTPHGLTINSFTSVSLAPPLILICISKDAGTLQHFLDGETFGVNILQDGQKELSQTFARHHLDRFANVSWNLGEYSAPIIENTLATIECKRVQSHDCGDHVIIIGEVQKADFTPAYKPLLYFRGQYSQM